MKKIVFAVFVVLMISSVVFAQRAMVIKENDLDGLKGTWEGRLNFGLTQQAATSNAKLEILNDTAPLKARLTISNVPSEIASRLSIPTGEGTFENSDGTLTTQGTIMWLGETTKNFFEVSQASQNKLNATFYYMGVKGDASLVKK